MNPDEFKNFLLKMMKNKEHVITLLFRSMDQCDNANRGLKSIIETIEGGSDANVRKQLKNTMIEVSKMSNSMRQMLMLMVIVVASDDFTSMIAKAGMKFGSGEEMLKEMFKQKLKGNA